MFMPVSDPAGCASASHSRTRKPLIALTPCHNIDTDEPYMRPAYPEAIFHAGGIPVTLPLTDDEAALRQLVSAFDAFLFTGGPDLHPFHFHEETYIRCGNVSPRRDSMELSLLRLVMQAEKPVLGICRGIQLLNVGLGGDIYQDIPSQFSMPFSERQAPASSEKAGLPADASSDHPAASFRESPACFPLAHTQPFAYDLPSHTVAVSPHTLLAELAQPDADGAAPQLKVNSMHHQAVRRLAPGLIASGHASDGIIEAIEKPDYPAFFLGVQWHPEYLWKQDSTAAQIFSRFVRAAVSCRN